MKLCKCLRLKESTYGTQIHEERGEREKRFTQMVHDIVARGGRCLIPAFALGRAQELLLILDEYWDAHPELYDIPVYCEFRRAVEMIPITRLRDFGFCSLCGQCNMFHIQTDLR